MEMEIVSGEGLLAREVSECHKELTGCGREGC